METASWWAAQHADLADFHGLPKGSVGSYSTHNLIEPLLHIHMCVQISSPLYAYIALYHLPIFTSGMGPSFQGLEKLAPLLNKCQLRL